MGTSSEENSQNAELLERAEQLEQEVSELREFRARVCRVLSCEYAASNDYVLRVLKARFYESMCPR
jgi:hypothetical protein